MPKFLLNWNGNVFPAKRAAKYGTRIERYLKNPQKFLGTRLIEVGDPTLSSSSNYNRNLLLSKVEELQNIDPCGWNCEEDPVEVIDESDEVCCRIYLYPVKWVAVEEKYA